MAKILEFTEAEQVEWDAWVESRPDVVKDLAKRFPPNVLFRLKPGKQRVHVISYAENGTDQSTNGEDMKAEIEWFVTAFLTGVVLVGCALAIDVFRQ